MKINCFLALIIAGVTCYSCKHKVDTQYYKSNKRLLSFQSKFVYSSDDFDKLDSGLTKGLYSDSFSRKTDTIKYFNDKIHISYLRATPGCAEWNGDILFSKDTLKLILINKDDMICTERVAWRVIYEIENKSNHHYFIEKHTN